MSHDLEGRVRRLEDLHAIQQLRALYCQYLDDGRWEALAELFTDDGAFVGLSTARGRDELRTFFPRLQQGALSAWWHFSSNETIELEDNLDNCHDRPEPGSRATGQTWLYQPCVVDDEPHIATGRYTDRMRRCGDGEWRFEERAVTFFYWVPASEPWGPGRYNWAPAVTAADTRTVERHTTD